MNRLLWVLSLAAAASASDQPIAYSHKQHIALGLECLDCHSSADTGASATIPSVRKCMLCHAKIATAKPEIRKLAAYATSKHEIPWQRVYGFPSEALVKFRHSPHFRARIGCAVCHGDMTQATTAERLIKHNMGTCLSCHRQYQASEDCAACHY
ncbi:Quinol:cytochrome c oxidoreductase pentaheme cytochrome subunit [Candidatus Sulfopaludibacter sp. SbA6]|nr:Quinol:cytochrome c oxidoreductase pentaheme cytochrome subunit [Candidatus Sulfopaludibacter sp. SbA6]